MRRVARFLDIPDSGRLKVFRIIHQVQARHINQTRNCQYSCAPSGTGPGKPHGWRVTLPVPSLPSRHSLLYTFRISATRGLPTVLMVQISCVPSAPHGWRVTLPVPSRPSRHSLLYVFCILEPLLVGSILTHTSCLPSTTKPHPRRVTLPAPSRPSSQPWLYTSCRT